MSKVFIETVGCPKNHEDSERMAGLLAAGGHEIVFEPDEADALIVNTCGFIEAAKRESIETIFDYAAYKEDGRSLIVTGCLAQRYADDLAVELPEVDAILGVNDYEKVPGIVSELTMRSAESSVRSAARIRQTDGDPGILTVSRKALSSRHSSYLKIA
jgi:ribosomal protein S12 methylthiotransferase